MIAYARRHPELRHVRTRVKSPGQNGSRERGFGTLKYERLFLDDIPDALELVERAEDYRIEYTLSALTKRSPGTGPPRSTLAPPTPPSPTSKSKKSCQLLDAGHVYGSSSVKPDFYHVGVVWVTLGC